MKKLLPHEKEINEYEKTINQLKSRKGERSLLNNTDVGQLEQKLEVLKQKVYASLTPKERVAICRHPDRPGGLDVIKNISERFIELHGDRIFADDPALVGGLATIEGTRWVVSAQEKGHDTESRMKRNFGMLHPEGYRKAIRLMRMAEKFNMPFLSIVDTPGAFPGLGAEERGQAWAIAQNLRDMARIKTPIIVVVLGEGCSGGALGVAVGDSVGMLRHAYYSVISPEGCASILWKDSKQHSLAAEALKLNSEDVVGLEVADEIIEEPPGGAHNDPCYTYKSITRFVMDQYEQLKKIPLEELLELRYQKFRRMGKLASE